MNYSTMRQETNEPILNREVRLSLRTILGAAAFASFVLGSLAKVVATLITYPLIRTKTVMQAQPGGAAPATVQQRRRGMAAVLLTIFREEGVAGLYRGFATQIFTAVSKSGVLLTAKEQLAAFALGLVLILRRRHARPALR